MTRRTPALALSLLTLTGMALFLGVLSGRPELFLVALPLVVALCRAALASEVPEYTLTHEVSGDRVFEGDTLRVTVRPSRPAPALPCWNCASRFPRGPPSQQGAIGPCSVWAPGSESGGPTISDICGAGGYGSATCMRGPGGTQGSNWPRVTTWPRP